MSLKDPYGYDNCASCLADLTAPGGHVVRVLFKGKLRHVCLNCWNTIGRRHPLYEHAHVVIRGEA